MRPRDGTLEPLHRMDNRIVPVIVIASEALSGHDFLSFDPDREKLLELELSLSVANITFKTIDSFNFHQCFAQAS